ncbi:MAG: glycosyltransferase family 9 protein [Candidatus Korobacteraceae bacterium]|jgi:heptosyltransferase-2
MKATILPPLFFSVRLPTLLAMFWRAHISRASIAGVSRKEPLSFIVFRLDSLGDVVLTTPLFRALKKAHPGSRCTVVVQECYKSLLVTNPHIDEILTLPKVRLAWLPQGMRRLLAASAFYWTRLRKRHFDFAISPRWDVDEHLATFLCVLTHAASRVGYSEKASPEKQRINRGFDAAYDICLPSGPVRHEVLRNLSIADALGATAADATLEIQLTERDRRSAATLLAKVPDSTKLVAIGIGAASPSRRWPLEGYADAINRLAGEYSVQPAIVGSAPELGQALTLAGLLQRPPIIVCGARLREVCAVLERCDLFLGNDSGCAHLAAAMDCKVIVISRHPRDGDPNHFNSPLRFAPQCAHGRVLQPATALSGCKEACSSERPHCITKVSVEEAVAAARLMLNAKRAAIVPPLSRSLPDKAAQRLLHSHSAEAVRRAVESLRDGAERPLTPV